MLWKPPFGNAKQRRSRSSQAHFISLYHNLFSHGLSGKTAMAGEELYRYRWCNLIRGCGGTAAKGRAVSANSGRIGPIKILCFSPLSVSESVRRHVTNGGWNDFAFPSSLFPSPLPEQAISGNEAENNGSSPSVFHPDPLNADDCHCSQVSSSHCPLLSKDIYLPTWLCGCISQHTNKTRRRLDGDRSASVASGLVTPIHQ